MDTAAEFESTKPPTIRKRSETASRGPRAPLVWRLSPNSVMPMTMLTRGSTSTRAAWEAPIGPAWKAFWVRKTDTAQKMLVQSMATKWDTTLVRDAVKA